jgi:membrane protein YqaA with SNARE-associated domain
MKILPDLRFWSLVIAFTALSLIGSVTKYQLGKKGLPVVQERFPQVGEERWDQAETYIERWGAPALLLVGIPGLGLALTTMAGAYGVNFNQFLIWVFLGKFLRNTLLVLPIVLGLEILF